MSTVSYRRVILFFILHQILNACKLLAEKAYQRQWDAKAKWLSAETLQHRVHDKTLKLVVHDPDSKSESAFNFAGFLRRFSDNTVPHEAPSGENLP